MAHTPGPWVFREPEGDELHEIFAENGGELICFPVWTHNQKDNIPLIAAAPELLYQLKHAIRLLVDAGYPETYERWQEFDMAVNQAEGRD